MSTQARTKSKGKGMADPLPARKKARKVVVSEPESEDEYMNVAVDVAHEAGDDDEDDYLLPDVKPSKALKGKAKAFSNTTASGSGKGGVKRKVKADLAESKDAPAPSKKRPKPSLVIDDTLVDVVGDASPTPEVSVAGDRFSPAASKHESPAPTPVQQQKKVKLPTIKKIKLPHLNTPTSATTPSKPNIPLPIGSKPTHDGVRKTLIEMTDIDLSNKSIYQELFSKTAQGGGGTPRTGINRRTREEERRKELNRQRDEAKAKRAVEAIFDLQAQLDKITRFEEKLKAVHSSALYPNFLAAKWREEWDKEKRRQKEKDWQSGYSNDPNSREEGEVK
ncbi:hypothetical protein B0H34DRAFT_318045 [Crassisporium funariophilum]|nr:hypothetical protein B0H34DRAFT_318045 [Crassisporium funariophilum]